MESNLEPACPKGHAPVVHVFREAGRRPDQGFPVGPLPTVARDVELEVSGQAKSGGLAEPPASSSWGRSPKEPGIDNVQSFPFQVRTWNIAGADEDDALAVLQQMEVTHVLAVQEWPRAEPGWRTVHLDSKTGVVYQSPAMYRGVAVFFDAAEFVATGKKAGERGIWIRLVHRKSGKQVWIGSVHLPHKANLGEFETCCQEFLTLLPKHAKCAILLGDFNTQFRWVASGEVAVASKSDSKWNFLKDAAEQQGLVQCCPAPPDLNQPSYVPRKSGVAKTQIDGIFYKGLACGSFSVDKNSRTALNSDHEQLYSLCALRVRCGGKGRRGAKELKGGPRRITKALPHLAEVTQSVLENLAKTHTSSRGGSKRFRASSVVGVLGRVARCSRHPHDWMRYLAALRKERTEWQASRLEDASRDWAAYRDATKPRKDWGVNYLLGTNSVEPTEDIRSHFATTHVSETEGGLDEYLEQLAVSLSGDVAALTEAEVFLAVKDGKTKKAVGPDLVSNELLCAIVDCPQGLTSLISFFQQIMTTGQMPESWATSVVKLLPKVTFPEAPKQLRPISLSSHTAKCLARILLRRVAHLLLPSGPQQLASKHRQAVDLVWATRHVVQVCREWGAPLVLLKTDIKKAFDVVSRRHLALRVVDWLGQDYPVEASLFLRLLKVNTMSFVLPWDTFELCCNRGVKQGATESPGLFSRLLDAILCETASKVRTKLFADLDSEAAGFMDDIVAWQGSIQAMQVYATTLQAGLAEAGLELQPDKCQLMCMGETGGDALDLGGFTLRSLKGEDTLMVMNLPIYRGVSDIDFIAFVLERVRQKFFSIRDILCSQAPLSSRLRVLDKVVLGSFRWMIGSVFPTAKIQERLNGLQVGFLAIMMHLRWDGSGLFHEWEIQRRRTARSMLHLLKGNRWGDVHLTQFWAYVGHRVRNGWSCSPSAAGLLSHHRPLQWWMEQQALGPGTGQRHGGRHFPQLMNHERAIRAVCASELSEGQDWRVVAVDKEKWKRLGVVFSKKHAIPWATGQQLCLRV